jgi:hypothetical protein
MRENAIKSLAIVNRGFLAPAIVEAESLFVKIPEQVERLDANVGSLQSALEQAPVVLKAVCVDIPIHVRNRMVDDLVSIFGFKIIVGRKFVGKENRGCIYVLPNFSMHGGLAAIAGNRCANFSTAFQEADYKGFITSTSPLNLALSDILVHVPRKAADESFVYLNNLFTAADFHKRTALHSKSDSVEHEPCGFLSDANSPTELIRTYSILTVGQHPNGSQPLVEGDRRILKDSPDLDAELPFGVDALALPFLLILKESRIGATTGRAHDAFRPAQTNHVTERVIGISKEPDSFLECFWLSHNTDILRGVV